MLRANPRCSKNKPITISQSWGEWNPMHKSINKRMKKAFIVSFKHLNPRVFQKRTWRSNWKRWVDIENLIKEWSNKINMVYKQNIERRSQKQLRHPLISKAPLHGEHPCLMHLEERRKFKRNTQNSNAIWQATKINKMKETKR